MRCSCQTEGIHMVYKVKALGGLGLVKVVNRMDLLEHVNNDPLKIQLNLMQMLLTVLHLRKNGNLWNQILQCHLAFTI